MATVHIPALLRDLTGDAEQVQVEIPPGGTMTVGEVLESLERRFPGVWARLIDGETGELVPFLAAFVEDRQAGMGLLAKVRPEDNLYFLAPMVGGA